MGHTRLREIPKTRKWNRVVESMFGGANLAATSHVANITTLSLEAAEQALAQVRSDKTVATAFYLLTQLALASRESNWLPRLKRVGINLPKDARAFDLASALHAAIDSNRKGVTSDYGEIAQASAGEALLSLISNRSGILWGEAPDEVKAAAREVSTKKGFSDLGQRFFGAFLTRFLNFHLSRVAALPQGNSCRSRRFQWGKVACRT